MADQNGSHRWPLVGLGDLGEVNRGRSRHRPRYAEHLYGGRYPFVQTGDIKASGGRITSHSQTYSEAGLAQSRLWPAGTMCITIAANIAETAILTYPACFPDSVVGFIPDKSKCDIRFVEYTFRHLRSQIQHEASGSVQDNINLGTLDRLRFPLPSLHVQNRISDILCTLDDKIELNRRMNETLEAMARRLFKSWFVDFDPVHAKATLRRQHPTLSNADLSRRALPHMAPEIAELFPDKFEESTLGRIPNGWRTAMINDIAENPRRVIQPSDMAPNTPYIALDHMPRKCIALSEWGNADDVASGKSLFHRGEILFGKLRPYFHKVGVAPIDGVCSTDILVVVPKAQHWFGPLLEYMSSDEMISHTDTSSTGTKMPRTSWSDIARFPIIIPPEKLSAEFTRHVRPAVNRIHANIMESCDLTHVRDKLLPRLMSGRLGFDL